MHRTLVQAGILGLSVAVVAAVTSCADDTPTAGPPVFHNEGPPPPPPPPPPHTFTVCKVGTSASFVVTLTDAPTTTVNLAAGECQIVADAAAGTASATEQPATGTVLDSIVTVFTSGGETGPVTTTLPAGSTSASVDLATGSMVATFYNHPVSTPGRMTGGGNQITIGDVKVTRGFTIHCDITLSNNLEINWPDNKWHITKPLTMALCVDDPAVHPEPPPAPFDTFIGEGIGEWNGQAGSLVRFTFVDAGEPGGKNDRAQIQVWAADGTLVLDVPMSFLNNGNLQAHYDQPHGNKP